MPTLTPKSADSIAVADIIICDRIREGTGNVLGLAESIKRLGLLHPVVLNTRKELIAGARRLAAVKKLGWVDVPCRVVATLDDAIAALQAERDENTCREPLSVEELFKLGAKLETLEKPKAKERKGGRPSKQKTGGNFPPVSEESGKTRDKVGAALGMSGKTYEKLKQVSEAAQKEPERFGDLPTVANERSIDAAHKELKERLKRPPTTPPEPEPQDDAEPVADPKWEVYVPEEVEDEVNPEVERLEEQAHEAYMTCRACLAEAAKLERDPIRRERLYAIRAALKEATDSYWL